MSKKLLRKKLALMLANLKKKRPYYCEVEYLEGTGTQYINTGLLSTANSQVDVVFGFSSMESGSANNCAVFGGRNQTTVTTFTFFKLATGSPQYFRFDFYGQITVATASQLTWDTTSKYRFTYDSSTCKAENITTGESVSTQRSAGISFATSPICLFAVNTNGTVSQFMKGRIYKYWYTDGTNTIDLIPVLDWNMTPCMYDKVSGELFYNKGTGTFTYGREIHYVDYLESTGTQYILTGYTPTTTTDFEVELSSSHTGQNRWVMGCPTWVGIHYKQLNENLVGVTNSSTATSQQYASYIPDNSKITLKLSGNTVYSNGIALGTITRVAGTQNLALFGYQTNETTTQLQFTGSIYKAKIWDTNVLVRDYYPAIDENGVGFMFDKVTHTIYDNAGTGAFKYPAVETEYLETTAVGACLDLGLKYKPSMSIECKYTRTAQGNSGSVFGLATSTTNPLIYLAGLYGGNAIDRFVWRRTGYNEQSYYYDFSSYPATIEYKVDAVNDTLTINGNVVKTGMIAGMNGYDSPYQSDSNMYMLSINGSYCGIGKQYATKIYDTEQVYRDLIPAWKDGEFGMYDKINGVLYTNTKTAGTIVSGKIVEPENE